MKKVALVFVLAVLVPSMVLAWLAVRSLRDQKFLLERQQSLLFQGATDSLARQVQALLGQQQLQFGIEVEKLLANQSPAEIAPSFDETLRAHWPLAQVGFVVTTGGRMLSPKESARSEARKFLSENSGFLSSRESAEVYWNTANNAPAASTPTSSAGAPPAAASRWESEGLKGAQDGADVALSRLGAPARKMQQNSSLEEPSTQQSRAALKSPQQRKVFPQSPQYSMSVSDKDARDQALQPQLSKVTPSEAEFQQLIGEAQDGTLARFVDNKLRVLFWHRTQQDSRYVFGAQLAMPRLIDALNEIVTNVDTTLRGDICVSVLDDTAKPVAVSHPGFQSNWKHPFVATEIGESLPHWEIAAYLLNPTKLTQSAQTLKWTLGLIIALLVLAIGIGGWLIVSDLNRQLTLARQKTDFVSNVSHELKTPLTSIRMFSEMLAGQHITDEAKRRSYLNIITAETARLTRLINNVLDFSRMERGEKKYNFQECDLVKIARETVESYRPHLENHGFKLDCVFPEAGLRIRGDCDALAQVLVNLLSNAEKYSGDAREIQVQAARRDGPLPCAEVAILDRGLGVPRGSEEKIFEKFYRAHDSLSAGIQGSGLGLTLARQIARAHGGDVVCERREGGGTCFSLRLPITGD